MREERIDIQFSELREVERELRQPLEHTGEGNAIDGGMTAEGA